MAKLLRPNFFRVTVGGGFGDQLMLFASTIKQKLIEVRYATATNFLLHDNVSKNFKFFRDFFF